MDGVTHTSTSGASRVGLWLGPAVFATMLVLPAPGGLGAAGWRTAATAALMAIWWLTEALPLPATALAPLVLLPFLGVLDATAAAAPYANPVVFLFLGGFLLAASMERWGLHKRIALFVIARAGTGPRDILLGFMIATAFLSMWLSNSATTAMMLPIATAIAAMFHPQDSDGPYEFGVVLMLGLAYAASIGGVATLIGTPPNAVLAAATRELLGREIGFVQWMGVGLPITCVMLPAAWLLLTRVLYRTGELRGDASAIIADERRRLGSPGTAERRVGWVFASTALAWVLRSEKTIGDLTIPGIQTFAPSVHDSTIAVTGALLLFVLPSGERAGGSLLDWKTARSIPWGVLILVGGGLSLTRALDQSGLAAWIGSGVHAVSGAPTVALLLLLATVVIFLTELASNVAVTSLAMPILAGLAVGLQLPALELMTTTALAASMAFMLPVATPPNAIVFGSGYVSIAQMSRAGLALNLMAIILLTSLVPSLVARFLAD